MSVIDEVVMVGGEPHVPLRRLREADRELQKYKDERDALIRWLDEQIRLEREWGGIAGNACADGHEHVKAYIEGRDTDE